MYSYDGPVIVPVGFEAAGLNLAIGKFADAFSVSRVPRASQPLQTRLKPRGMRKEFASTVGSVIEPGSSPPPLTRPRALQVLPPRLGGSYITWSAPFLRSIGVRTEKLKEYSTLPRAFTGANSMSTMSRFRRLLGSTSPNALPTSFSY